MEPSKDLLLFHNQERILHKNKMCRWILCNFVWVISRLMKKSWAEVFWYLQNSVQTVFPVTLFIIELSRSNEQRVGVNTSTSQVISLSMVCADTSQSYFWSFPPAQWCEWIFLRVDARKLQETETCLEQKYNQHDILSNRGCKIQYTRSGTFELS